MAKTVSGALVLTKTERKALEKVRECAVRMVQWGEGGCLINLNDDKVDKVAVRQALLGIETLNFILQVTD